MTNELIATNGNSIMLYDRMTQAIATCWEVDDCLKIGTQAQAIAAYYKQIRDDESVRKFLEIRLRAWRRIGEIVVNCGAEPSDNVAEYIRRIDSKLGDALSGITDHQIRQALKLMRVPDDFFVANVGHGCSIDDLFSRFERLQREEWEATPEGIEETERIRAGIAANREADEARKLEQKLAIQAGTRAEQEAQAAQAELKTLVDEAFAEAGEAFGEVGITLNRHDRLKMKQIVMLLKSDIHMVLRQAAFDHHMTMQAVLRSALRAWLVAHDYTVPIETPKTSKKKIFTAELEKTA